MIDRSGILAGVQDFYRSATHVFVFVSDEVENGFDDPFAADSCQGIRRPRADPPVFVGDGLEQMLDVVGRPDLIENLHSRPSRKFILGLESRDEILGGIRMIELDDDVHGLIHDIDVRVEQETADQFDADGAVELGQPHECRLAHQLVVVLELFLEYAVDIFGVEPRDDVDQVHLDDGIFPVHA